MTDFLPRYITTVARTRRPEQASSDEGLWQRSKRQGKQSLVVLAVIFICYITIWLTKRSSRALSMGKKHEHLQNSYFLQIPWES